MFLHRLDLCCPAGEVGSRDEVAARAGGLADSVLGVAADAADAVRFPTFDIHARTLLCPQPPIPRPCKVRQCHCSARNMRGQ